MIPLLAAIISVYCVLRLLDMTIKARRYEQQEKANTGDCKLEGLWMVYAAGAVLIIGLLVFIFQKGNEVTRTLQDIRP